MSRQICMWLWILVLFTTVQDAYGDPPFLGREEFSFSQWKWLRGLDSNWGGWDIHLGGQLAGDAIKYDSNNVKDSGVRWETATALFLGAYENRYFFQIEPDLLGIDTRDNLFEAWAAWKMHPALRLKAGQVKVALNTEFATRSENFPCVDYGFSSYLDGRYDLGVQIDGNLWSNTLWYEASAALGDGFDIDGNRKDEPQVSIRAVVSPLTGLGYNWLKGAFFGLGFAYSTDYEDEFSLATPLRSTVFDTVDLVGDSAKWIHSEVGWYWGAFRVGAERAEGAVNDVELSGGSKDDLDQLTSWSAYGSWYITGQRVRQGRGRWLPPVIDSGPHDKSQIFDFLRFLDPLGCLEIAFRYSNADIDRDLFVYGLTRVGVSTQEVRTATLNLNWYPQPGMLISAGWVKTKADQDLFTFGGKDEDSSYILRTILTF